MSSAFFSSSYSEARTKFLRTCGDLGLPVEPHVHPERGREDEELATDVVRLGAEDAEHVLFTMSATHGVEGFCGSAVQTGALRSGLYDARLDGMAVVLIHAINPYAAGRAAELKYGGANVEAKRRSGRAKSKRRQKERLEAGLCIRCGGRPPVEGGTRCAPCRDKRQAAERRQYAERRATGCGTRCGGPVFDGLSRCAGKARDVPVSTACCHPIA